MPVMGLFIYVYLTDGFIAATQQDRFDSIPAAQLIPELLVPHKAFPNWLKAGIQILLHPQLILRKE